MVNGGCGCYLRIWPPKNFKDLGSRLHSKLKEAVMQTGIEKNVFGNHLVSFTSPEHGPPPASAGIEGLKSQSVSGAGVGSAILEIDSASPASSLSANHEPNYTNAAMATTRKGNIHFERQNSDILYFADDEDVNRKKYTRRGPFHHKFLRALLPFWSSALPTLPVKAPSRKETINTDDISEGRLRQQNSSRMDPRKILLLIAVMACMATMGILYYRIAQGGLVMKCLMTSNNDSIDIW